MSQVDAPFHFNPEGCAPPIGGYHHATIVPAAWPILVLAGQVGTDRSGYTPQDASSQYRTALQNVVCLLKANGLAPRHIIKLNSWLVEPIDLETVRELRRDLLGGVMPPSTLCYVSGLATPDYLVEIEVWAAAPSIGGGDPS